jgi:hypothetical protein
LGFVLVAVGIVAIAVGIVAIEVEVAVEVAVGGSRRLRSRSV